MAVALATLTETRGEKTWTQVIDTGETGRELIASISEYLQGNGHGNLLSDRHYNLSDEERKPQPNP
jgi:hypothetical protein